MPKEVRAKLIDRIKRTATVESFRFKPAEKLEFTAGQFVEVIFDEENRKNRDLNKYLSFSCSPGKDYIEVTKRLSASAFSAELKGLRNGDEVLFRGPLGNCVLKPEHDKVAFLVGGIGITPVISIIEHIKDNNLAVQAVLFYSNRTVEDIAFKKELDACCMSGCNIKVIHIVTDCPPKDNICEFGTINRGTISANIPDIKDRIVFVYGPPKMVEAVKAECLEIGCSLERLRTESFAGY